MNNHLMKIVLKINREQLHPVEWDVIDKFMQTATDQERKYYLNLSAKIYTNGN